MKSLLIKDTIKEEREEYIKQTYRCISDCDMCGNCRVFKGKTPEIVFAYYIDGLREYSEVAAEYRQI